MELADYINTKTIKLNLVATEKNAAIKELTEVLIDASYITDRDAFYNSLLEREKIGSTGIGKGIAIPHTRTDTVKDVVIAFGRSQNGVEFDSLDGKPAHLIFLIAAPIDSGGIYLKALARLSRLLRYQDFRDALLSSDNIDAIIKIISEEN